MIVHTFEREEGGERCILFDDNETIVELPTRFCLAKASRARYSKKTVRSYLDVLKAFCLELERCGYKGAAEIDEALASMGPLLIEDWFARLKSEGKSGYTLRTRDVVLKTFMDWLTTEEAGRIRLPSEHPYADNKLKTVAPHAPVPKYLTYLEVSEFIRHGAHDESQRCLIHFMYDTGVRVSEIPRVKVSDLPDMDGLEDVMYFPLTIHGSKGRGGLIKQRQTIISRAMLVRLLRLHNNWRLYLKARSQYSPGDMPAFLNVRGEPLTAMAVQKYIQAISQKMQRDGRFLKNITPHSFRHGTAFSVLKSEHGREPLENLIVCQRVLGHESIKTTENYTRIPAPIMAQMRQFEQENEAKKRYQEAEYIYEQTFKPQRIHTEKRGRASRHNKVAK